MSRLRRIALYLILLALGAGVFVWKQWTKPHADFTELDAAAQLSARELVATFDQSTSPWLNQPIEVTGRLAQVDERGGAFEGGVVFTWAAPPAEVPVSGDDITLHGRLVGFDDLFGEARMDQCVVR